METKIISLRIDSYRVNPTVIARLTQHMNRSKEGPLVRNITHNKDVNSRQAIMSEGKKMIHVCAYCIAELSVSYPHSVVNCRHKARAEARSEAQHFY